MRRELQHNRHDCLQSENEGRSARPKTRETKEPMIAIALAMLGTSLDARYGAFVACSTRAAASGRAEKNVPQAAFPAMAARGSNGHHAADRGFILVKAFSAPTHATRARALARDRRRHSSFPPHLCPTRRLFYPIINMQINQE